MIRSLAQAFHWLFNFSVEEQPVPLTAVQQAERDLRAELLLTDDMTVGATLARYCAERIHRQRKVKYCAAAKAATTRSKHDLGSDPIWGASHG